MSARTFSFICPGCAHEGCRAHDPSVDCECCRPAPAAAPERVPDGIHPRRCHCGAWKEKAGDQCHRCAPERALPPSVEDALTRALWTLNDSDVAALRESILASEANLRARLRASEEALRRLEWSFRQTALRNGGTIYTAELCPACMGERNPPDDKGSARRRGDPLPPAGHRKECWLASVLTGTEAGRKVNE